MSRFKIFASVIPLILAGVFARESLSPQPQPCIRVGNVAVQMATAPWQSQSRVSFTDNPAEATVRVQIVETPDNADFTVVDDIDGAEPDACAAQAATRYIGIAKATTALQPIIYLSSEPGDFRIFVQSKTFSPQAAAALVVGAGDDRARVAAAAL
ncbi:MAG: hypothetical protein J0I08_15315 [Rhizobiales bacterium]|jgi:hypothetical protein|nr:hypothetical protein [Hyphomicrobiales bacterium]